MESCALRAANQLLCDSSIWLARSKAQGKPIRRRKKKRRSSSAAPTSPRGRIAIARAQWLCARSASADKSCLPAATGAAALLPQEAVPLRCRCRYNSVASSPVLCFQYACRYQKSTVLLIRKAPFQRLVREIASDFKVRVWCIVVGPCMRFHY